MRRKRDYKTEYANRIARGLARGQARQEARGHAPRSKPNSAGGSIDPSSELERAIKALKRGASLKKAAAEHRIAPERLRRYLDQQTTVTTSGGRLQITDTRPRRFPIYSNGKLQDPILVPAEATRASAYLRDVDRLLNTGQSAWLTPYRGKGVTDVKGTFLLFETDENELYRLDAAGELYFPEFYKITTGENTHG